MKLVLGLALSFAAMGCVDDVATGGGQLEGIQADKFQASPGDYSETRYSFVVPPDRIEKPTYRMFADHITDNLVDPAVFTNISVGFCSKTGCTVAAVVDRWQGVAEITYYVNDTPLCKIVRDDTGTVYTDCN